MIAIIIIYFWIWTSGNRSTDIDVLNQMCRDRYLNITFHTDGPDKVDSIDSKQNLKRIEYNSHLQNVEYRYKEGSIGEMPKLTWYKGEGCEPHTFKNNTINNGCLVLSKNVGMATWELIHAEIGDKTFLLIIIFTMAWSTWHLNDDKDEPSQSAVTGAEESLISLDYLAKKMEQRVSANPIRIFVAASLGTILVNWKSLTF